MLSISHALTGAFIASRLPDPVLYVPLTLAAHYLEDWIPHWDVGTGLSTGRRRRQTAIVMELVELAITAVLVGYFWKTTNGTQSWHIFLGAFCALIPDFMEAPRNFLNWEPSFLKPFNDFHNRFHHSTLNKALGLLPQAAVVGVIFWMR